MPLSLTDDIDFSALTDEELEELLLSERAKRAGNPTQKFVKGKVTIVGASAPKTKKLKPLPEDIEEIDLD